MKERIFEEVKTYMLTEKKGESTWTSLVLEKADGERIIVGVWNGGGYVTQLDFEKLVTPPEKSEL